MDYSLGVSNRGCNLGFKEDVPNLIKAVLCNPTALRAGKTARVLMGPWS